MELAWNEMNQRWRLSTSGIPLVATLKAMEQWAVEPSEYHRIIKVVNVCKEMGIK